MDKHRIIDTANEFVMKSEHNYLSLENAISRELAGIKIFEEPIFAFGSADDELFKKLKDHSAIGEEFMVPKEWLPSANTVICYFLPFSDEITEKNKYDKMWPSDGWLHGRIEGQFFVNNLSMHLCNKLKDEGYEAVVPVLDKRFGSARPFTSNWSERHAAFICGLGTFGLSKGLITEKGMAGRLGSIITSLVLEPDERKYKDIYEYCTMCGACAGRCPVSAISLERGKDHKKCSEFLDITKEKYKPRYGCGKCQVAVPCSRKIPTRKMPHGNAAFNI